MTDFDVVSFTPSEHPTTGETAPDFTRPLVYRTHWKDTSLSELTASGPVVLVFSPLNWGGKSMYWWKEIQNRGWGNDEIQVVGLGISQPFDHQRFIEARDMPYPLFSDPPNDVATKFDLVHDLDGMAGISEPRPAVYVLDGDRKIVHVWVADEWPEAPAYDEIEAAFDRL